MNPIQELSDNTKAQMRKGLLEFCILIILSREPRYSSDILTILKDANLLVVEGTLYPLLSRLKRAGMLDHSWKESVNGPPRKYYSLTPAGHDLLLQLKSSWQDLASSINTILNQYE